MLWLQFLCNDYETKNAHETTHEPVKLLQRYYEWRVKPDNVLEIQWGYHEYTMGMCATKNPKQEWVQKY